MIRDNLMLRRRLKFAAFTAASGRWVLEVDGLREKLLNALIQFNGVKLRFSFVGRILCSCPPRRMRGSTMA